MTEIMKKADEQKLKFDNEIKKHQENRLKMQEGNVIFKLYNII